MCVSHPTKHMLVTITTDNIIRCFDYQSQRILYTLDDFNKMNTTILSIAINGPSNLIIAGGNNGNLICFSELNNNNNSTNNDSIPTLQCVTKITVNNFDIINISIHGWLPIIFTLSSNGELITWLIDKDNSNILISINSVLKPFNIVEYEKTSQLEILPEYSKYRYLNRFNINPLSILIHSKFNFITFLFGYKEIQTNDILHYGTSNVGHFLYNLYSNSDISLNPTPISNTIQLPVDFYFKTSNNNNNNENNNNNNNNEEYQYPNKIYYMSNNKLKMYSVSTNDSTVVGTINNSNTDDFKYIWNIFKLLYFDKFKIIILGIWVFTTKNNTNNLVRKWLLIKLQPQIKILHLTEVEARDAIFYKDLLLVLSENGDKLGKISINLLISSNEEQYITCTESLLISNSSLVFHKIFNCSENDCDSILFYNEESKSLYKSTNELTVINNSLKLTINSTLLLVQWQKNKKNRSKCAIVTLTEILIINEELEIENRNEIVGISDISSTTSCLWIGNVLLISTFKGIFYVNKETIIPLITIELPYCNMNMIMQDRIMITYNLQHLSEIKTIACSIIEPLLITTIDKTTSTDVIKKLITSYNCNCISSYLLEYLEKCDLISVCILLIDLLPLPQIDAEVKYNIALRAHRFEKALEILLLEKDKTNKTVFVINKDKYNELLTLLNNVSLHFGQFDIASQSFQLLDDYFQLLYLYVLANNSVGIQSLAERAKRDNNIPLLIACQHQLEFVRHHSNGFIDLINWPLNNNDDINNNNNNNNNDSNEIIYKDWILTGETTTVTMVTIGDNSKDIVSIRPLILDDIKKYFLLESTVKSVKLTSLKG